MIDELKILVSKKKEYYYNFLSELIRANTTVTELGKYGNEANGQQLIIKKLHEMGLDVNVFEPDIERIKKYEDAYQEGHDLSGRHNVVGVYKGERNGRSLLLNGHIDTMPFDSLEKWICYPTSPVLRDGKIYGRGSADMKGGLAGMILALETIIEAGLRLDGDVIIESVVDEEGGGNGTLACVDAGYRADFAIVGEPTSLEIFSGHMGYRYFNVRFTGRSLHCSVKNKGENAIQQCVKLIDALNGLEKKWKAKYVDDYFHSPEINIGTISGGKAASVVPDSCELSFGITHVPIDKDGENVEQEFRSIIQEIINNDIWMVANPPEIKKFQQGIGYRTDSNHPFFETLKKTIKLVMDYEPTIRCSDYGCDARLLYHYGKIPTIIFGPGSIDQAHTINEYLELNEYYRYIEIMIDIIVDWCGKKEGYAM